MSEFSSPRKNSSTSWLCIEYPDDQKPEGPERDNKPQVVDSLPAEANEIENTSYVYRDNTAPQPTLHQFISSIHQSIDPQHFGSHSLIPSSAEASSTTRNSNQSDHVSLSHPQYMKKSRGYMHKLAQQRRIERISKRMEMGLLSDSLIESEVNESKSSKGERSSTSPTASVFSGGGTTPRNNLKSQLDDPLIRQTKSREPQIETIPTKLRMHEDESDILKTPGESRVITPSGSIPEENKRNIKQRPWLRWFSTPMSAECENSKKHKHPEHAEMTEVVKESREYKQSNPQNPNEAIRLQREERENKYMFKKTDRNGIGNLREPVLSSPSAEIESKERHSRKKRVPPPSLQPEISTVVDVYWTLNGKKSGPIQFPKTTRLRDVTEQLRKKLNLPPGADSSGGRVMTRNMTFADLDMEYRLAGKPVPPAVACISFHCDDHLF